MEKPVTDKRRSPRRHCALTIELRPEGTAYFAKCVTTDLTPEGCYVRLLSIFPKGTVLEVVLWAGSARMRVRGKVATADVNVGNGIEFVDMPREMRGRLENYLAEIEAPEAGSAAIFR